MSDNEERYYAAMESERNDACDRYFGARKHLDSVQNRDMFGVGFERAFKLLWKPPTCFAVYAPTRRCEKPVDHDGECGEL